MKSRVFARKPVVLALSFAFANVPVVWAQETTAPVNVDVTATRLNPDAVLEGAALDLQRAANPDTASLLTSIPGVNTSGVGTISNLPTIRGMADNRLTIKVDGVDAIASCPNHMNPPLSYAAPSALDDVKVYKSISPVSVGLNSIGGAIVANTSRPIFSQDGKSVFSGQVGAFYYSNGDGHGANASATGAGESVSVNYTYSTSQAGNYKAGGDFNNWGPTPGPFSSSLGAAGQQYIPHNEVGSTGFMAINQSASLGWKILDDHLLQFQYTSQSVPYQGYANQRMDMLGNNQDRYNLRYWGRYGWGKLEGQAYSENINHFMQFGPNKQYWFGSGFTTPGMPMYTNSNTYGGKLKADIDLNEMSVLRTGGEYQFYYLNDWWPPSGTGSMAPNNFINVNGGTQQIASLFGEWEKRFTTQLKTILGARYSWVGSATGQVHGYNLDSSAIMRGTTTYESMNHTIADSQSFNNGSRNNQSNLVDLSALGYYTADSNQDVELGLARKQRAPSLYELYPWSSWSMASIMNNFLGDGNGYVGNPNLSPETAYTISGAYDLHTADRDWQMKASPYYSYIQNYIDAVQLGTGSSSFGTLNTSPTQRGGQFVNLMYQNQNAQIAGAELAGRMPLGKTEFGTFGANGFVSYTYGRNQVTGNGLYNIMPLNGTLNLTHRIGGWDNALQLVAAANKSRISVVRNEIATPGYMIANLKGSYTWSNVRLDAGINNIFNKLYYNPMGGAYVGQGNTMSSTGVPYGVAMPMPGMSVYTALNVKF